MRGRVVSARSETTPQALRASSPYTGEPAATEASPPKGRWLGAAETEGWFRRAVKQPLRRFAPALLTFFAPTQLFELRRCSGRLIRQAETLDLQSLRDLRRRAFLFLGMVIGYAFLV